MSDRPFDIILFGATGFTGKLVAEYLAKEAKGRDVKWAIAGRNPVKLEAVRAELARTDPALGDLHLLTAESHDVAALDKLAPQTRVVCTTVGPYLKYGKELVAACARAGTSYCDLTGETPFVRMSADSFDEEAKRTKARIVHCAGFDSIPSEMSALLAREHAGEDLAWVKMFVARMSGGLSGGTISSMFTIMEQAKSDRDVRRLLFDPHGLDPEPSAPPGQRGTAPKDPFEDDQRAIKFDKDIGRWTAPFVMAAINTRVVRRSHAILKRENQKGYGPRFRYNEAMSFGKGPAGLAAASLVVAGLGAFMGAAAIDPVRALLERTVLPAPGEGPSKEQQERGFFEMRIVAKSESGKKITGRIAGNKDPGYGQTAVMLAESAICLAKDALAERYGVLTPATAMGMPLVTRLRAAGMTLEAHDA
jgi:short subunit dehydrogenase-like uncharacterized protein